MMDTIQIREQILNELEQNVIAPSEDDLMRITDAIDEARQIFFSASAREMLVLSAFAMRVFHMGYKAYLINETKTPPIGQGDLLIILCGSGEGAIAGQVRTAQASGAKVLCITAHPEGPVAQMCEYVIRFCGQTLADPVDDLPSFQPMGSSFEQAALVTLDYTVHLMMKKHNWEEPDLEVRHTNME